MGKFIRKLLESHPPLYIVGVCGIVGVSVDVDHFIAIFMGYQNARFLHTPVLIVCSVLLCCAVAYLAGLYIKLVLKKCP